MGGPYADLHELLDRLTPEQAEAIRVLLREFAGAAGPIEPVEFEGGPVRRLSFVGLIPDGPRDLAERSEEIIRTHPHGVA